MNNSIIRSLCDLGLSAPDTVLPYHPRVRDREDVRVLRCKRSGVIVLETIDHATSAFYEDRADFEYWKAEDRNKALRGTLVDDQRRAEMLRPLISNKRWLDIGTGLGGILDLLRSSVGILEAVEPQAGARAALQALGYEVYKDLGQAPDASFDVISLFHVYEHIVEPIEFLHEVKRKLAPGGKVVIEIPHANDALLTQYDCLAFRDFTLWSEHLILHTRQSLSAFVTAAGLKIDSISGIQRYPLANHLHWLSKAKPGGHVEWQHLCDVDLDRRYEAMLASLDMTDTLLAWVSNNPGTDSLLAAG